MKTVKFITALLIMFMTVGVTSIVKAQGEPVPYTTYDNQDISDWVVTFAPTEGVNTNQYNDWSQFISTLTTSEPTTVITMSKNFNLSGWSSIDIQYEYYVRNFQGTHYSIPLEYEVYIDNNLVLSRNSTSEMTTISNPETINNMGFTANSVIKIVMGYNTNLSIDEIIFGVSSFIIVNPLLTSINDNSDISDKIDVYSYNKSVFITADEFMDNADITVYNMNGQIVHTSLMNLSNSKSELALNDINSGMYIVNISNGVEVVRKKVVIQ